MKKYFMTLMALILGVGMLNAHPVDVSRAKMVGQQFVQANFELNRQNVDLELVYTGASTRGEACFYVFNLGNEGFVMVSADDAFRPIVGYSKERAFDTNINPELAYMLDCLIAGRSERNPGEATPLVAAEWNSVTTNGKQLSFNGGRSSFYLLSTTWNQDENYNYFCPVAAGGPGGRVYAGCVATAMAQVMKYWNHPLQGTGSHTNYNSPNFGALTANFGATTYDWANMPNSLEGNPTQTEIEAVATLIYHCGIAVDMNYKINGSGAYSADVPGRIAQYFGYTNQAYLDTRDYYSYAAWSDKLKESLDMDWPMYYNGHDPSPDGGGHAFVCDGYDDANLFHYNWGWDGSDDAFYDFDLIDYNTGDGAIFNFVPSEVYNITAQAPTNFTVTKASETAQVANISWTNPSKTLSNANLTSIDQVVITRDGKVIYTEDNVTPGAAMTYVDNEVPCYTSYLYKIYVVTNGHKSKGAKAVERFGPTCTWQIMGTANNNQGWKEGRVVAYDGAGKEAASFTMTNSNPTLSDITVPLGHLTFAWEAGTTNVQISFKIKDSSGNWVYEQPSISSETLAEGSFFTINNGCGNIAPAAIQGELFASEENGVITLNWNSANKTDYGYNVYRDGVLCGLVQSNEFVDVDATVGGHCYMVCALSDGGESELSNEVCATAGEHCGPGNNLWIEFQTNFKPMLTWDLPSEGIQSGFRVFRKKNENGQYEQIKMLGPNATEFKETDILQKENWYYYRVVAEYESIECTSAPFKCKYGNEYFVKCYYDKTGVEDVDNQKVSLFPNPTKGSFTVNAEQLQQVMVYNAVGQLMLNQLCEGNSTVLDLGNVESGIYMVKVISANGESIQKLSVIR